jgi:hypothetical protein
MTRHITGTIAPTGCTVRVAEHGCTYVGRGMTLDDAWADAERQLFAAEQLGVEDSDECDRVFAAGLERRVGA